MRSLAVALAFVGLIALAPSSAVSARETGVERLPSSVLDVAPPAMRVRGVPGQMSVQQRPCRVLPMGTTRRRLVDVAVQEWGFFGFRILDRTDANDEWDDAGDAGGNAGARVPEVGRRLSRLPPEEAARVASSIAGYWAVTPEGTWIVERQNELWNGPYGTAVRWNAPWSAAFVSWVTCEAGLGAAGQFQRAIAHHAYIDQAIRARDGRSPQAAFVAYDVGEAVIAPGDLLCSSRRPAYRTIAERQRQMGGGARTHCDVVVQVDEPHGRILAIGGNIRGAVTLKLLTAVRERGRALRPAGAGAGARPMFAHLKLRAETIEANALDASPTIRALGCAVGGRPPVLAIAAQVAAAARAPARC